MGLRAAANKMCKECIYDKLAEGSWRAQVESCTSQKCPLFGHRPRPLAKKGNRSHKLMKSKLARGISKKCQIQSSSRGES